jgi:hypothetical protein
MIINQNLFFLNPIISSLVCGKPLQGGWNNRNKPSKVDETGPETSCGYSLLKGKEEIATTLKNGITAITHNIIFS